MIPARDYVGGVVALVRQYDLKVVGGCCGTNSETLKALDEAFSPRN